MFNYLKRLFCKKPGHDRSMDSVMLDGIGDWAKNAGLDIPEEWNGKYDVKAEVLGESLGIMVRHQDHPEFGIDMIIEINHGVPCVHLSNQMDGDCLLHLFATSQGVAAVPDDAFVEIERQPTSLYYPGSGDRNTQFFRNPIEGVPSTLNARDTTVLKEVV